MYQLYKTLNAASDRPVAETTYKRYFRSARHLHRIMYKQDWDFEDCDWMKRDPHAIMAFITDYYPQKSTAAQAVSVLCSLLRKLDPECEAYKVYGASQAKEAKKAKAVREENKLGSLAGKVVPWPLIIAASDRMLDKSPQRALLFTLMKTLPRRAGTYRVLTWRTSHDHLANYVIEEGEGLRICLNTFKLSARKSLGPFSVMLPGVVWDRLRDLMRVRGGMAEGDPIFVSASGRMMSQPLFSAFIRDTSAMVLGVPMTSRHWRISKATNVMGTRMSVADREREATRLGHNRAQMELYAKVDLEEG